ncbi:LANO_0A00914g1_1 [Lachancea nothofagi CBS 11611]|uniref:LANO_0A00914g1_1 n=1 Tax=Lachancea nothofagi CBS 11611 TaxID=1266666 RepID=A0A1G4IMI5_9SACH|nr:LANO_0A00914g1_1 [Lachancea nothofagi CBS 11611]
MDVLSQYKASIQSRLDSADVLVSKLVHENRMLAQESENKDDEIESLKRQLDVMKKRNEEFEKRASAAEEEVDIVRDLFEHLCGVRVHKSYEDDSGLWFDTSQGGRYGVMDYKLGFVKAGGEVGGTEVVYVPLLKQRSAEELQLLQKQIPGYLFDTLSFPLRSLNQFYMKLGRCLGKAEKTSD